MEFAITITAAIVFVELCLIAVLVFMMAATLPSEIAAVHHFFQMLNAATTMPPIRP